MKESVEFDKSGFHNRNLLAKYSLKILLESEILQKEMEYRSGY